MAGWRKLVRRIARAARGGGEAEDLLQSAFIRLQAYSAGAHVVDPAAFLVRTAINLAIDERRKCAVRGDLAAKAEQVEDIADFLPLQDEVVAARERLMMVTRALDELSDKTRTIFLMHRLDGMKYRDIAAHFEITVSAVEKHIAKAVLHLARLDGEV